VNGKETSLFDAYDENGEFLGEDGGNMQELISPLDSNRFTKLRAKVRDISNQLHGDYDIHSAKKIKKHVWGRLLMTFRNWIPETARARFGGREYNRRLERYEKGRYRTFYDMGFKNSFYTLGRVLGKAVGMGSNPYALVTNEEDVENIKKVIAELIIMTTLFALGMTLKLLAGGDDDDDDKMTRRVLRTTINQLTGIENEFRFYISPTSALKIIKDPVPILRIYSDAMDLRRATWNYMTKDDKRYSGGYWFRNFAKQWPLGSNWSGIYQQSEKIFSETSK
jgi:hypothetical protein